MYGAKNRIATSYPDLKTANKFTSLLVSKKALEIEQWFEGAELGEMAEFYVDAGRAVGYGMRSDSVAIKDITGVTVVFMKMASDDLKIVTSYPQPHYSDLRRAMHERFRQLGCFLLFFMRDHESDSDEEVIQTIASQFDQSYLRSIVEQAEQVLFMKEFPAEWVLSTIYECCEVNNAKECQGWLALAIEELSQRLR